jgi:hypothetical protein
MTAVEASNSRRRSDSRGIGALFQLDVSSARRWNENAPESSGFGRFGPDPRRALTPPLGTRFIGTSSKKTEPN